MLSMQQIPAAWLDVLRRIQDYAPGAVLVGGALRDLHNGRPVKDLDIFLPSRGWEALLDVIGRGFEPGSVDVTKMIPGEYRGWNPELGSLCTIKVAGVPEVNLITVKGDCSLEHLVRRCDFGLCQIGTNGDYVMWTDAYEDDWRQDILTLVRSDDQAQFDRSMERYARLTAKYPQHKLVIPGEIRERLQLYTMASLRASAGFD